MQTIGTRQVYENPWMRVREDSIRRQDGSAGIYGVVDKPDFALVVPLDGDRLHMVEQFRYPIGLRRWEFPQGTAPGLADVDPLELAARELREETGLELTGDVAGDVGRSVDHALISSRLFSSPPPSDAPALSPPKESLLRSFATPP